MAEHLHTDLWACHFEKRLLHGDLHHDNILFDQLEGWVAIDRKGVIDDPAYEAARLQHNPIPRFLGMDSPKTIANRRFAILSSVLQEDRARLMGWAFVDTVLAACWSVEENGSRLAYHVGCAKLFDLIVD